MKATILAKRKKFKNGNEIFVTGNRDLNEALEKLEAPENVPDNKNQVLLKDVLRQSAKKVKKAGKDHFLILDPRTKREMQENRERHAKTTRRRFKNNDGPRERKTYRTVSMNNYSPNKEGGREMANEKRVSSPFGSVLNAARKITTRKPREEQSEEYGKLIEGLRELDERGKSNLFFHLMNEVLEEKSPLEGLFAVGFKTGNGNTVHHVAAIRRAMLVGGLNFEGLVSAGLAEIKVRDNKSRVIYRVGKRAIEEAIPKLIELGEAKAAKILAEHLRTSDRMRIIAKAKRESRAKITAETTEVAKEEPVETKVEDVVETENVEEVVEEESTETDENVAETPEKVTEKNSPEATA